MEDQEQSVNIEEVAEPQVEEVQAEVVESENTPEVAEPDTQDAETNARFAENRRKQELDEYKTKAESYSTQLERLSKLSGYQNSDDFIKALDGLEEQLTVQQEAEKMGLNEEDYRQFIAPTNQKVSALESELNDLRGLKVDMQLNDMGVQDKDLRNSIKELVKTKGYDPQDAHKILTYDTVGKNKEQEVLANIEKRNQNQVLSSNDKPGNLSFDPNNMTSKDIASISERVQRGERITF